MVISGQCVSNIIVKKKLIRSQLLEKIKNHEPKKFLTTRLKHYRTRIKVHLIKVITETQNI